jgi:hypothetical protein
MGKVYRKQTNFGLELDLSDYGAELDQCTFVIKYYVNDDVENVQTFNNPVLYGEVLKWSPTVPEDIDMAGTIVGWVEITHPMDGELPTEPFSFTLYERGF